ncbi:Uu.00g020320.m01.CDS01 [Anthostomella pinea]|uniref:Uu.00g020320.m01.CDS01 n=1 Tax=Anthostomella pinea TaxID=933095 RepID=A0AAI8VZG8_9PEZI|nr:Uu.00g020320.m01.CDS01 [Anthostomella pinea]
MAESEVPAGYTLLEGYPSVDDYVHLRAASGLTLRSADAGGGGPPGQLWYFLIADMATLPKHRRKGLADVILKRLLARIKSHAAKGTAYVTLGADVPGRRLYERNGFKDTMPKEMGMSLKTEDAGQ